MSTLRNVSTREKAYRLLKSEIINNIRKPGERLIEDALADEYMVSRTPLREAIHKLEMEGFLTRLPVKGLVVSEYSVKEIEDLYQVRSLLEGLATRITTQKVQEDPCLRNDLIALKENLTYCQNTNADDKIRLYCNNLHIFIRESSQQIVCKNYLEIMCEHIDRYKAIGLTQPGRLGQAYSEHMKIINLMLEGKEAEAEREMLEHVQKSGSSVVQYVREYIVQNKKP